MGCCNNDGYRADGCMAKMTHGILDFVSITCVIIVVCLTVFPLTSISPRECYLDGEDGWQYMGVCNSVYIVSGLSLLVACGTSIIHCFTCCFHRIGFLVEAIGEIIQAVMWCSVSIIWDNYGTPEASPGVPRDFADEYNSVKNQREAVLNLGYVIMACTIIQACIATYRFIAACCWGKRGDDNRA